MLTHGTFGVRAGVLGDTRYFTRRTNQFPGPGIIPSRRAPDLPEPRGPSLQGFLEGGFRSGVFRVQGYHLGIPPPPEVLNAVVILFPK
jgi:hypothetical protein